MSVKGAAAVILAAGIGSRMKPLTDREHKSLIDLGGVCALGHILKCLSEAGVGRAAIVVGYMAESIMERFGGSFAGVAIDYVENKLYDHHGCEYSMALAAEAIGAAESVLITEADLLMPAENYLAIETAAGSAVLIRRSGIDPERSVVALGDNGRVSSFAYDGGHVDVYRFVPDRSKIVGESLQLWKFAGEGAGLLAKNLLSFRGGLGPEPDGRNGLYSINATAKAFPLAAVEAPRAEWINLNVPDDVETGRRAKWLKR